MSEGMLDIYHAGKQAALDGAQHWENPHCQEDSFTPASQFWYAGWCAGMQENQPYFIYDISPKF